MKQPNRQKRIADANEFFLMALEALVGKEKAAEEAKRAAELFDLKVKIVVWRNVFH